MTGRGNTLFLNSHESMGVGREPHTRRGPFAVWLPGRTRVGPTTGLRRIKRLTLLVAPAPDTRHERRRAGLRGIHARTLLAGIGPIRACVVGTRRSGLSGRAGPVEPSEANSARGALPKRDEMGTRDVPQVVPETGLAN